MPHQDQSHGTCSRCETLPSPLPERGVLYIVPPISHTGQVIESFLTSLGFRYEQPLPNIYVISFHKNDLKNLCSQYFCTLSFAEQEDTKCLILEEEEEFTVYHLTEMEPLSVLNSRIQGEWLIDLLQTDKLVTHFQPIVSCADPAEVFGYECLLRGEGKDGLIMPGEMFSIASAADLMFNLDRAARLASVRGAAMAGITGNIFINFIPTAIYAPEFCLQTTLAAINKHNLRPEQVTFEVVESEQVKDTKHLVKILSFYKKRGFGVALDDIGAGYSSLNLLAQLQPDYIKLDLELVRDVHADPYKAVITKNLLDLAAKLNVRIIAEGVESREEWLWLKDNGADLVQGYLFARPDATPPRPIIP